jgi:hypothetical protein
MTILETLESRRTIWQRRAETLRAELDNLTACADHNTERFIAVKQHNLDLATREIRMLDVLIRAAKSGVNQDAN